MSWELSLTMFGAVTAAAAAPLGVIVFYLRAVREEQRAHQAAGGRRFEQLEAEARRQQGGLDEIRRAYTTKDEWLRETMLARQHLERLGEVMARVQADVENLRGLASQFGRATTAIVELADHLAGRASSAS